MRWVRANRAFGSRLALFALAVQFVLAFGHMHPADIYGPAHLAVDAPLVLGTADHFRTLSTDHRATGDNDFCEICATISLLNTSFVPAAPHLPVPFVSRVVEHVDRIAVAFIAPRRAPFQSRAPPAA